MAAAMDPDDGAAVSLSDVYFLIAKFLKDSSPCQAAAATLEAELVRVHASPAPGWT